MPLDVRALGADFVVSVGYKWLLGPLAVGYLYVADEHRDGAPLEENWIAREGSEDFARLVDYRDEYQPGARRYDVGQRTHFELLPMAIAALEQLHAWTVAGIGEALAAVTGTVAARAADLGLDPLPVDRRGPHMLGLRLPASVRSGIVARLAADNCFAALRGETLRIAPHLNVTDADVDRLVATLADAISH